MKIAKLKSDKLGSMVSGAAGKAFVAACRLAKTLHQIAEEPTGYLFIKSYKFKDETCSMLILGDLTTGWLKFAKALKKENPKNVLFGECFAEVTTSSTKIILLNKSGTAKLKDFVKNTATIVPLLKKADVSIDWAKNMSDEAAESPDLEQMLEAATLDDAEDDTVNDYLENEDESLDTAWTAYGEEAFQIKSLLEELGAAKKTEKKTILAAALRLSIPAFLDSIQQVKGIAPAKLFKFKNDLEVLWAGWQKPKAAAAPAQEATILVKQAFELFSKLKAAN